MAPVRTTSEPFKQSTGTTVGSDLLWEYPKRARAGNNVFSNNHAVKPTTEPNVPMLPALESHKTEIENDTQYEDMSKSLAMRMNYNKCSVGNGNEYPYGAVRAVRDVLIVSNGNMTRKRVAESGDGDNDYKRMSLGTVDDSTGGATVLHQWPMYCD